MLFKYPEVLYALFLLIIPILIHLFQLRRFQKVPFTNVKFLKNVQLQTRKSSQLKKWLVLFTRMLMIACAVIAFAQPYVPFDEDFNETQETVVYLDNSFSMQANGRNGTLMNEAVQDLLNTMPEDETISLFTNNKTFKNTTIKGLKNELIQLKFSPYQLNYDAAYLKGKALFSDQKGSKKNLLLVSDFQTNSNALEFPQDSAITLKLIQPKSNLVNNVSIDSLYLDGKSAETLDLTIELSNSKDPLENISVSLFNEDKLLAKSAATINGTAKITFTIPANTMINGKVLLEDSGLQYDNNLFFNINQKPKIKVLGISESAEDNYLKRIFTEDEFEYRGYALNALNFNLISEQNLVILNELEAITSVLTSAISAFHKDGGSIVIIPSDDVNLNTYNELFRVLGVTEFEASVASNKRVTGINYDHPLLENSFYAKVSNFQYPKIEKTFQFSTNANSILSFEDGKPFLTGRSGIFSFSAAINTENSNFKNSQLIVPVLYNIGLQSLKLPRLYYTIGQPNSIAIKTTLGQDDILNLDFDGTSVIPLQNTYSTSVVITTDEFPDTAGTLSVKNKSQELEKLSFNYPRTESKLQYFDLNELSNADVYQQLSTGLEAVKSSVNINALWKWFVIFVLVFLVIEMLILKYL